MTRKYALLIGINYKGQDGELNGCINDVKSIKNLLISKFAYDEENIIVMTDDSPKSLQPTGMNIMNQLGSLIIKAYYNYADEIFFHYSGHGSWKRDTSGDETDGRDECLVPLDCDKAGMISDDLLHNYLQYIPEKTNCIFYLDCCHSASILDLPYRYIGDDKHFIENNESRIKGNIVMISGCEDKDYSSDAYIDGKYTGAMTNALLYALKECNYEITYYHLLEKMRKYLKDNEFTQVPQLCSSRKLTNTSIFCAPSQIKPMMISKCDDEKNEKNEKDI